MPPDPSSRAAVTAGEEITVETYQRGFGGDVLVVAVTVGGERHVREMHGMDDADHQDLRIAAMFWRHAERAFAMGYPEAGLTEQCLAVERLFPHLREELPA